MRLPSALQFGAVPRGLLRAALREGVWRKPWGHGLKDGVLPAGRGMSQIGG